MATRGWMRVAEPVTRGPRMYASIAWPPSATISASNPTSGPLKASAMSTATPIPTGAPISGTNSRKKVKIPSTTA